MRIDIIFSFVSGVCLLGFACYGVVSIFHYGDTVFEDLLRPGSGWSSGGFTGVSILAALGFGLLWRGVDQWRKYSRYR
ncbi:MAG TPA: hypothetical protein DF383_14005 [Deltaproteobacteria bacterium]|nr:hypothetical protein [Deltaproteobacteria bacterium]